MKNNLQKKISNYREQKNKKSSFDNFLTEKRKNIDKIFQDRIGTEIEKENDFRIQNYTREIDMKHKKYLQDMDELQNIKFKIIEVRGNSQTLKLEMSMQQENLINLTKAYKKEIANQEEMVEQVKNRHLTQRNQRIKMEQERCKRNIEHIEKLTNQKQELINRTEELLLKRKSFDVNLKKIKESFDEEYKKQKELWIKGQQQKKQKWQSKKLQKIIQNTLKGLEPQINRIVSSSRSQISKIQQKYETITNQYKKQMNNEYENNVKQIRRQILNRYEQEKQELSDKMNEQYKKALEKIDFNHQSEKTRLKMGKEAELRELQSKRKQETQEFMFKNKDYLINHLNEIKLIKSNYQEQIRKLDGSIDKLLESEENIIKNKYQVLIENYKEQKRRQLEGKIKAFHNKYKKESEDNYESLVEIVAQQNQKFQINLKLKTQMKIKQYRENNLSELKNLRKSLQIHMTKQKEENDALKNFLQLKETIETEYEELKRQNEYLKKKQTEYQLQVLKLKETENQFMDSQQKDVQKIEKYWEEQIDLLNKKIGNVENEMITQQKVMKEKKEEQNMRITEAINKLQKQSLQYIKRINQDMQRARKERSMKMALNSKLHEMKKKIKDMQIKRKSTKL